MWFEIVYGVEGVNKFYYTIVADDWDDAYNQAYLFACEEYENIAGKVDGYPSFSDFWHSKTADNIIDIYENNRVEYNQLCKQYSKMRESKIIVRAYYI